ncbi:MAG: hypothetical protein DME18_15560 [Verrucomicrobia bacterium]|nr:MAG: hypothetical protein DME18_15560 [Verrucomicrobiota bacterium]
MLPDAPIQIAIVDRDLGVAQASIDFQFDGNDVTGAATVASNALGALITYQPPSPLALNSTHTNRLVFSDERTPPQSYTNQWTFKVANLPVLLAAWGTAPGSGLTNGFNGQIHKARNGAQNLLFPNSSIRAENQLANLLNDADTGQPFVNEAAGPNGDGLFSETHVINYSQDGTDQGLFSGDQPFPYINPADYADDPNHIAMAVTAHLELSAGLHRFGVRRDDGFKLAAGPDFTAAGATLVLGAFEPTSGAESPNAATEFDFNVPTNGVYPVRLVFFENSGGADIEWYSVNRATRAATLINDPSDSSSVKAYMSRVSPVTNPQILNPTVVTGNFQFSYATVAGRSYFVEYKDSLSNVSWQSRPAIDGDGSTKLFTDPINAAATRFYRIRVQ